MTPSINKTPSTHPIKKTILILWTALFVGSLILSLEYLRRNGTEQTILDIKTLLSGDGSLDTAAYFLLFFVFRNFFFIPSSFLLALGGVLFGIQWGILLSGIGQIIGSILGFFFARYFGRDFFRVYESETIELIDKKIESHGFITIAILRFIPILPFDLINFSAGLSRIHVRDFLIGTVFFVWPDTIIYVLLGSAFHDPRSILYALLAIIIVVGVLWYLKTHPHFKDFFVAGIKEKAQTVKKKVIARQSKKK